MKLPATIAVTEAVTLSLAEHNRRRARYDIHQASQLVGRIRLRLATSEVWVAAYVRPWSRGRGIGTAVMRALLAALPQKYKVLVAGDPRNSACIRFMESCGFHEQYKSPTGKVILEYVPTAAF